MNVILNIQPITIKILTSFLMWECEKCVQFRKWRIFGWINVRMKYWLREWRNKERWVNEGYCGGRSHHWARPAAWDRPAHHDDVDDHDDDDDHYQYDNHLERAPSAWLCLKYFLSSKIFFSPPPARCWKCFSLSLSFYKRHLLSKLLALFLAHDST